MRKNNLLEYRENDKLKEYLDLSGLNYILTIFLQNPIWVKDEDFIQYLDKEELEQLKNKELYLVIDWTDEGFSPTHHHIFEYLYNNLEKYNIDPDRLIYFSSNLLDNDNIKNWCKEKNCKPINVLGFRNFEIITTGMVAEINDPETQFYDSFTNCKKLFKNKIYSSLSRALRENRIYSAYETYKSEIGEYGAISHSRIPTDYEPFWIKDPKQLKKFKKWCKTLPLVVDRRDFNNTIDWQMILPSSSIFNSTLFHIANESLVDKFNNTSLFYTEKTFKPMFFMQPFVIWGQQGVNHYLKDMGFKLYDDYFDLEFDWIEDDWERYNTLLKSITPLVKHLASLNKHEQLSWRYQHRDVLIHNYKTLVEFDYSKTELKDFLEKIKKSS